MLLTQFENFLSNISFSTLFLTTCYYWVYIVLGSASPSKNMLSRENWSNVFSPSSSLYGEHIGMLGIWIPIMTITVQLGIRGWSSGHFPLSNLYESLLFLSWALLILYQYIEHALSTRLLGAFILPLVLCLVAFTGFSLPAELQSLHPLVPALQSNWLVMHVSVMILSYAGLLIGSVLSILYLVVIFFMRFTSKRDIFWKPKSGSQTTKTTSVTEKSSRLLDILDSVSYRTIGIGFCFLTLGILSGAVWANETWGTYWSWDPKETWALITWFAFATYLHARFIKGWQGFKPAWIASCGFFIIWMCYLGVNLLGQGLHNYGFFQI